MYCNTCNEVILSTGCGYTTSLVNPTTLMLDASQILYHKDNGSISELTNLNISNGGTLELILETIDAKVAPLTSVLSTTLTYLRTKYVVNDLSQFLVSVSTELGLLNTEVLAGSQWTTVARPTSPIAGQDGYNLTTHHREYWNESAWVSYP